MIFFSASDRLLLSFAVIVFVFVDQLTVVLYNSGCKILVKKREKYFEIIDC